MAFVRTVKQAVMTKEEIDTLKRAVEVLQNIDHADADGDYFSEIDSRVEGVEWHYIASILNELADDADLV